jgi:hypothetical protein
MNYATLNYDDFDLDLEMENHYSLPEAINKAREIRKSSSDIFVRIREVGSDKFVVIPLSAAEVQAEWTDRFHGRFMKMLRRRFSR